MPYIKKSPDREKLNKLVNEINNTQINTSGDLNYLFTMLAKQYILEHKECYQTYNDIVGALVNARSELYRRKIGPYEDKKIEDNGDVW